MTRGAICGDRRQVQVAFASARLNRVVALSSCAMQSVIVRGQRRQPRIAPDLIHARGIVARAIILVNGYSERALEVIPTCAIRSF